MILCKEMSLATIREKLQNVSTIRERFYHYQGFSLLLKRDATTTRDRAKTIIACLIGYYGDIFLKILYAYS